MLVLMRRKGEKIMIGDNILVEVTEIRGEKVRIGITAPREISIDREEVKERKNAGPRQTA